MGASFEIRRQHDVMDADWRVSSVTARMRTAPGRSSAPVEAATISSSLASSPCSTPASSLAPGTYLALLSHSGSRGTGAGRRPLQPARAQRHPELPKALSHLAWLELSSEAGQEYWAAMELMGRYAAANHALIHAHIARELGVEVLLDIENHHNFAWRERHRLQDGTDADVVVHRKATPAGAGVLGIIPGSMGTPGTSFAERALRRRSIRHHMAPDAR